MNETEMTAWLATKEPADLQKWITAIGKLPPQIREGGHNLTKLRLQMIKERRFQKFVCKNYDIVERYRKIASARNPYVPKAKQEQKEEVKDVQTTGTDEVKSV